MTYEEAIVIYGRPAHVDMTDTMLVANWYGVRCASATRSYSCESVRLGFDKTTRKLVKPWLVIRGP
jgi:hypothetical protein